MDRFVKPPVRLRSEKAPHRALCPGKQLGDLHCVRDQGVDDPTRIRHGTLTKRQRLVALVPDLDDRDLGRTLGALYDGAVANALTEESLRDRRRHADLALREVELVSTDDTIRELFAIFILDGEP